MRLVAVSRVLNEDDIIEAFVRHHAPLVDHHVLLDNGSIDRTLEILKKLHALGVPITVFSNRAPLFVETAFNTFLYRYAVEEQKAEAVLFLDADEFVDLRRMGMGLRKRLAAMPATVSGLQMPLMNYHASAADHPKDLLVPRRIHLRDAVPTTVTKVLLRRLLPSWKVVVDAGNHKALFDGKEVACLTDHRVVLAHFSERSNWRWLARAVIARLRVMASGQQELAQNRCSHYIETYEKLRDAPHMLGLTNDFGSLPPPNEEWIDDRISYYGAALTFTEPGDARLKALRSAITIAQSLAEQHGRLVDTNHAVRLQVEQWAMQFQRVV